MNFNLKELSDLYHDNLRQESLGEKKQWKEESIREIIKKIEKSSKDDLIKSKLYEDFAKECLDEVLEIWECIEEKNKEINYYNEHDIFTGLQNRQKFIKDCHDHTKEDYDSAGVAFVDINGLKYINNYYGIQEGDNTIRFIVDILKNSFKKEELYRISGDEFVVMSININREEFIEKMENFEKGITIEKEPMAAIGFITESNNFTLMHVVEKADNLMRIEKEKFYINGNKPERYSPVGLAKIMTDIKNDKYVVYYQPKVKVEDGNIYGAEALVRYVGENGNIISPSHFITEMEKNLTIVFLDYFVFESVCRTIKKWNDTNMKKIHVSTNFSRITLSERSYINNIERIRKKYGIEPEDISIEITETVETFSEKLLEDTLDILKDIGYNIELDDYGKDFSSIGMLKLKSIDIIKIDRCIIIDIEKNPRNKKILGHLCKLCHDIDMRCLVEGIEKQEDYNIIKEMGYDYAQGYLFGRPVDLETFEKNYMGQ